MEAKRISRRQPRENWGDKEQTITFRVNGAEKELFKMAAKLAGLELAAWVRNLTRLAAQEQFRLASLSLPECLASGEGPLEEQ